MLWNCTLLCRGPQKWLRSAGCNCPHTASFGGEINVLWGYCGHWQHWLVHVVSQAVHFGWPAMKGLLRGWSTGWAMVYQLTQSIRPVAILKHTLLLRMVFHLHNTMRNACCGWKKFCCYANSILEWVNGAMHRLFAGYITECSMGDLCVYVCACVCVCVCVCGWVGGWVGGCVGGWVIICIIICE